MHVGCPAVADWTAGPIFEVTTTVNQKQLSQELQGNGSLGALSLTAGTYSYDEYIDYPLTADILPGMYGFLVNAGICPSAAAPCFAATRGFRQPSTLSIKAYAGFGQGTFRFTDWLSATGGIRYSVEKSRFDTKAHGTATDAPHSAGVQQRTDSTWRPRNDP